MAINSSDFSPASLSGTVTVNSSAGTTSVNIAADLTTEGPEKFVIKLRTGSISGPVVAATGNITINDTSVDAEVPPVEPPVDNTPTYSFLANVASVSEGQAVRITLNTTNLSNGNVVPYSITGVASADIGSAPLSGNFTINNNTALLDLPITADLVTEGTETLTVRLTSAPSNPSVSVTIVDSSVAPPVTGATYELTNAVFGSTPATSTTANEGVQALIFYLSIYNASNLWGTQVPYTITGVSPQDISIGAPSAIVGSFNIPSNPTSNPVASVTYAITADLTTEGTETLVMTLDGKNVSTSVTILDTSTTPALPPTYSFSLTTRSYGPTNQQVLEYVNPPGSAYVNFVLVTTNIVPGTQLPFSISGIQQGDITSSGLTWNAAISKYTGVFVMQIQNSFGGGTPVNQQIAQIQVDIVADGLTEGNETMQLSLDNGQASVAMTIIDNSLSTPPTFTVTPASSSVNEGSPMIYTVGGSNIINGTYYWTIQNDINFLNDFGTFSGSFTITNNAGTFSVTPSADLVTEGTEAFSIELRTGSATGPVVFTGAPVTINDSSLSPVITGSATITAANTRAVPTTLPAAATWVAFRVIGAGGSGAGNDATAGGAGGGANYVSGIVKLPATAGPKTLYGFVGRPGRGANGNTRIIEEGGYGENCSPTVIASGANSQIMGPGGVSGDGGAGGGASSFYYQTPAGAFVPIVTVGGGGGGGGGSFRTSGYGSANTENKGFITFSGGITGTTPAPGLQAVQGQNDGGGGGGGGGAAGSEGYLGADRSLVAKGGSAGYVVRNDSDGLTWSSFDWYGIGPVPPSAEGVPYDAPQPFPWVTFGRGGTGSGGGTIYGQSGQMGAIAAYWTTAATAPSLTNVPEWAFPAVTIPGSVLANRDMQAGTSKVTFWSWGAVSIDIDNNRSTSCFIMHDWGNDPINGIGEFLEILVVTSAPSNGQTRGVLSSNIPENTWTAMKPTGPLGYYVTSGGDYINATISIRRRDNQAVLRTVTYYNISAPAPYYYGGY